MKKLLRFLPKSNAGFTMIELLVVIAVIGVLAVAVLSSINPIEQINKGRDTRTRSDAAQLINAVDRYFAIHEEYPWNVTSADYTSGNEADYTAEFVFNGGGTQGDPASDWDWVDLLVSTAEVKEGFTNRLKNDDGIVVFKADGTNETMYTCFIPTSEAFKFEAARNCENGTTPDGLGTLVTCATTDGTIDPDNMICLP